MSSKGNSQGPDKICKKEGLENIEELHNITGISVQTLYNWYNSGSKKQDKTRLFYCALLGAKIVKSKKLNIKRMLII